MKINLLRDDQVGKSSGQKKDKDLLSFDDTMSGGNDDFYFEQPTPRQGKYRGERKLSFGWFVFIIIFFGLLILVITNPHGTKNFLSGLAHGFAGKPKDIKESVDNRENKPVKEYIAKNSNTSQQAQTKDDSPAYNSKSTSNIAESKQVQSAKNEPVQEIIRVEKPIYKKVVKTSKEEKVLDNPPIYEKIRNDIALTKRNFFATEYAWSKVPGGVTMETMTLDDNVLRIVLSSRSAELIKSYPNVLSQNDMFMMIVPNDPEIIGDITQVYMYSELPDFDPSDRPEQIWNLQIEWLDDYLKLVAADADVEATPTIKDSELLESEILVHHVNVEVKGDRTAMMVFLHDIQDIPASITIEGLTAKYNKEAQTYVMDLDLFSYERR